MVGEGANDVLRAFIAMVGIKPLADHLMPVLTALKHPVREIGTLVSFGAKHLRDRWSTPDVPVRSESLRGPARLLGRRVRDFHLAVLAMMRKYREALLFRQYVQERIADAACELYASSCTLARLDHHTPTGRICRSGRFRGEHRRASRHGARGGDPSAGFAILLV
jgi:hypothetical protein